MNMQALMDAMNKIAESERAKYHLTLGALIKTLEAAPASTRVQFEDGTTPREFQSYRGYYSDLAITSSDPEPTKLTAGVFLNRAKDALHATFEGYKGGDFVMHEDTPLWRSEWGDASGDAIMAAEMRGGALVLIARNVD